MGDHPKFKVSHGSYQVPIIQKKRLTFYLETIFATQVIVELNLSSDALRLALIYKHGGWYADIDTVIMKPLSKLVESHPGGTFYISSDQKNKFLIEVRIFIFFQWYSLAM